MYDNLIANSGIQLLTVPLEVNLNDNFKMYFHQWLDVKDAQLKLEIAHYFSEEEVWVKKHKLTELGFATLQNDFKVTDSWQTIQEDDDFDGSCMIPIDTGEPVDSGCFQESIGRIKWERFENVWFPMPFFYLNGRQSEF